MKVFLITWLTIQETRQRRLLHLILGMSALFLLIFVVGFYFIHTRSRFSMVGERSEVTNFLLLTGLYAVNFLGIILAVVLSADTISGDVESGVIQTIVTKPLRRWEVVLGKWLGLAILLSVIIAAMSGLMILSSWLIAGVTPLNFVSGIGLMVLGALVLLSVSILGGTRLSTLANGVLMFMLYALSFVGGWTEQIGAFMQSEIAKHLGILVSFLLPSEAMWTRASYLMQPVFLRELGFSPFAIATAPSSAMVVYALIFIVVVLFMAVRLFQTRDL